MQQTIESALLPQLAESRAPHAAKVMGTIFRSAPGVPVAAVAWGVVAVAMLIAAGMVGSVDVALIAFMPLVWSVASFLYRPPTAHLSVRPTGLEMDFPAVHVPYNALQVVRWNGRAWRPNDRPYGPGRLTLVHREGTLELNEPRSSDVTSEELYAFLWWFIDRTGAREVNPKLFAFVREQESLYGADKVFTFTARTHRGTQRSLRRVYAGLLLSGLVGLVWVAAHRLAVADELFWRGGWMAAIAAPLVALLLWASSRPSLPWVQDLADAGLVVSPGGLALVHGPVEGVLTWNELQAIRGPESLWRSATSSRLWLHVRGARIAVADVFDRPLIVIWQAVHRYWRPPPTFWN